MSRDELLVTAAEILRPIPFRLPRATYRLQFNHLLPFREAEKLVPYLDGLGISDLYASPCFKAREGSMHGYDVVDYASLSDEAGGEEGFVAMAGALRRHGMGLLLDIVPNHMCVAGLANSWWQDVLENGPSSPYADYFDIDWLPVKEELRHKVLLPVLGDHYGRVLEAGQLQLRFQQERGAFVIDYYEQCFPVNPDTYGLILEEVLAESKRQRDPGHPGTLELLSILTGLNNLPRATVSSDSQRQERLREARIVKERVAALHGTDQLFVRLLSQIIALFNGSPGGSASFDLLHRLLAGQCYRLSFWQVATEEINYRRFFDINELGALRVEQRRVFDDVHVLVFDLVRRGLVTGLRVDHPDGLQQPQAYFSLLQQHSFLALCFARLPALEQSAENRERLERWYVGRQAEGKELFRPMYIVGEKILLGDEALADDWPICGTTGYRFMNLVNQLTVESGHKKKFTVLAGNFTKARVSFAGQVHGAKKKIMTTSMASEINMLGHQLNRLSEGHRYFRDFTLNNLTAVLVETMACFPVYRTYVNGSHVAGHDRKYLTMAIDRAKRSGHGLAESCFDFLAAVLTQDYPPDLPPGQRRAWLDFTLRFQQLTGPVMAKGMEDTVFYLANRLVSLNEVGGTPERFGISPADFHRHNMKVGVAWPFSLLTTSTHDAKRSEDVRARISVLSEVPELWAKALRRWSRLNRACRIRLDRRLVPDRNEEYLFYQTLLGSCPRPLPRGRALTVYSKRLQEYMVKAVREGKKNSNWLKPDLAYEEAVSGFVRGCLGSREFRAAFLPLLHKVSRHGMYNSLTMTVLKMTCPGVPDFYQGTELWSFTLVDPDNRQPVDFERRLQLLTGIRQQEEVMGSRRLARQLTVHPGDGRIKLFTIMKTLGLRKEEEELLGRGSYQPLEVTGVRQQNLVALARTMADRAVLVMVPRLTSMVDRGTGRLVPRFPKDTMVIVPQKLCPARSYRNIFTDATVEIESTPAGPALAATALFKDFPVAVLLCQE